MTRQELTAALQSIWTRESGASLTIRKGPHTRTCSIPKENKQDVWIRSGRILADGSVKTIGRFDARGAEFDKVPNLDGWTIAR